MIKNDSTDIVGTILNKDVSVIFNVCSVDQGNELVKLCNKNGIEPIVLNEPMDTREELTSEESTIDISEVGRSSWKAFFSDRWAVASVAYLTAYFAAIAALVYYKIAR